MKIAPVILR